MKLTGNKDVDRKILNELDDKDLVKFCVVDKQANTLCNDQVFWMNRVFDRFGYVGGDVLRKYKADRTWSEYYINDLRKIKKENLYNLYDYRLDHIMIAVNKGANIHKLDVWGSDIGYLILINSIRSDKLDIVKYLIDKYLIDKYSLNNNEILMIASKNGSLNVVKYILEKGADIHADSDEALRLASSNANIETVKYLVGHGADISKLYIPRYMKNMKTLQFFIDKGYDANIALEVAARRDNLDATKYLISIGTNPNNKEALLWTAKNCRFNMFKFLIEKGADINSIKDEMIEELIKKNHLHCNKKMLKYILAEF